MLIQLPASPQVRPANSLSVRTKHRKGKVEANERAAASKYILLMSPLVSTNSTIRLSVRRLELEMPHIVKDSLPSDCYLYSFGRAAMERNGSIHLFCVVPTVGNGTMQLEIRRKRKRDDEQLAVVLAEPMRAGHITSTISFG